MVDVRIHTLLAQWKQSHHDGKK